MICNVEDTLRNYTSITLVVSFSLVLWELYEQKMCHCLNIGIIKWKKEQESDVIFILLKQSS